MFYPKIAIFAYDFPHWKSENILLDCLKKGLDVKVVIAAPKFDLNTKLEVKAPCAEKLRHLCKIYGVQYVSSRHDDLHNFKDLVRESECCLLYTSPSPRDYAASRMPSSA